MARIADVPAKRKLTSYRYVATTSRGEVVKGTVKAANAVAAEQIISERGYEPVQIEVAPSMFSLEEAFPTLFNVKPRDIIVFSRQMATLLKAGISLLPALEMLQGQVAGSMAFRRILGTIANDIRSGESFSQAVVKHPRTFSDIYCRTIAVGEESGNLVTVLQQMADYMEKQSVMGQKIRKALTYPIIVISAGVMVVILLITFVMPKLIGIFTTMTVELPLPTRILMAITEFVGAYQLNILIVGSLLVALIMGMAKQPSGKRLLDRVKLMTPIIGPPALMSELGRFARTVSVLIQAGLKLQDIMEIIPQTTSNGYFRNALNEVRERLFLGEGLSGPMSHLSIFPPLLVQMVAVGEESNTLEFTLGVIAEFYETTADEKATAMVGLIGPLSTIGIAFLVGFIALAVILPMYSLTGVFD